MNEQMPLPRLGDITSAFRTVRQSTSTGDTASTDSGNRTTSDSTTTNAGNASQQVDRKALDKALNQMNTFAQNLQRNLQFSVDEGSGETVVRVIDSQTKEVIRQIPSQELLDIASRLRAMDAEKSAAGSTGMLVKESV